MISIIKPERGESLDFMLCLALVNTLSRVNVLVYGNNKLLRIQEGYQNIISLTHTTAAEKKTNLYYFSLPLFMCRLTPLI